MNKQFFEKPILNSPYDYPGQHWELDASGQPTQKLVHSRRSVDFITPIPKARKQQGALEFDALSSPHSNDWRVTPETARLLQHSRHHKFGSIRPFFCQVEAVETAIWLTEVAPQIGKNDERFLKHLDGVWATLNSDTSRPFDKPKLGRVAVKVINHFGDEVMKVFKVV